MALLDASASTTFLPELHERVKVVLVETSHPGNIGAVARAMKNMGLSNLVLVRPKEFPSDEATRRASGADTLLESATVCNSLVDAVSDCHLVIGASARSRTMSWPELDSRQCADKVLETVRNSNTGTAYNAALVFGPEATGLTNDDLQRCQYHVCIPANPDYSSLNLAMAVQILTYELRMAYLHSSISKVDPGVVGTSKMNEPEQEAIPGGESEDLDVVTTGELEQMLEHMEQALIEIGFHDPDKPRQLMPRLRRLYQRSQLEKMELNIIRGILKATQKAVRK